MKIKDLPKVDRPREKLEIIKNPNLEKFLLDSLPRDDFKKAFRARLKIASPLGGYWQIMSEMRAIHIFHNILKIPVEGIEIRTVKKKDVDFVCDWHGEKLYVEVKGFRPIDYAVAKRGGWIGTDEEKIDRALARSQNKFLEALNIIAQFPKEIDLNVNDNIISLLDEFPKSNKTAKAIVGRLFEKNPSKYYDLINKWFGK